MGLNVWHSGRSGRYNKERHILLWDRTLRREHKIVNSQQENAPISWPPLQFLVVFRLPSFKIYAAR